MVRERLPAEQVDASILGTPLTFRNSRQAKNRFLKAALTERISTWDPDDLSKRGIPTKELINLYDKWGHGGFGAILTGNVLVDPRNLEYAGNPVMCKENDSPEMRKAFQEVVRVAKQDGALIVAQLSHAGRQAPIGIIEHPYSCSDVQLQGDLIKAGKPIAFTLEQIKTDVVDRFVYSAKVAYETGFDGVEIHAGHGFLLSQFLSPTSNKRADRYGGSLENRIRVIIEIYEGIRKEISAETGFIVGIKINTVEFQEGGFTTDDSKKACSIVEKCGFDFAELSGGTFEKLIWHHERESTRKREAYFFEFAEKIRPVFKDTVVYVTGGFRTAWGMVNAIKGGITDGIGLGRPITAEPDLPRKILEGHCLSAPNTKISSDDFKMTFLASSTQIGQMSKLPANKLKNVCEGIADLSIDEEAENFKKAAKMRMQEMQEIIDANKPVVGLFDYKNLF